MPVQLHSLCKTTGVRRPDHVQVEMRGYTVRMGLSPVKISVDLVEQGTHTVGAYVLMLAEDAPAAAPSPERSSLHSASV